MVTRRKFIKTGLIFVPTLAQAQLVTQPSRRNAFAGTTAPPITVSPTDFSGLGPWWKADSLALSNNDPVSTWTDSNGSNNATSSGSARPLYKTNTFGSKPSLLFDGVDDLLATSDVVNIDLSIPGTVVVVLAEGGWFLAISGPLGYGMLASDSANLCKFDSSFNPRCVSAGGSSGARVIINRGFNFRENKVDRGTIATGTWSGGNFAYNRIASWPQASVYYSGHIAELCIWPSNSLSDADCDSLYNNYFKGKYYPSLP